MEHRWGKRHRADIRVQLRTEAGLAASGRIDDMSLSGAHIVTPMPLGLQCRLKVTIAPGMPRSRPIILEAEVVRQTPDGFGVEWREFGHETIRALSMELDPVAPPLHRESPAARAKQP